MVDTVADVAREVGLGKTMHIRLFVFGPVCAFSSTVGNYVTS